MKIFREIASIRAFLHEIRTAGRSIGLVPTMGALHDGHLALLDAAKSANSITVTSIYVNPTQFNNAGDLEKYPRTLEGDLKMLEEHGCDVVFCPSDNEMYPDKSIVRFDFAPLDKVMEGQFRPGHFSGVALVVAKLFNIVQPTAAYFGQKDWQQVAVVRRLANELRFNLDIVSVPIVREADGLAMSSRNRRLTPTQRLQAVSIHQSLMMARKQLKEHVPLDIVKTVVNRHIEANAEMKLEYFELADSANLTALNNVSDDKQAIMCIAAFAGEVRLIDNMFVD